MNAHAAKILMSVIIHIVHMLCSSQLFSLQEKQKLLELTSQLQAAMDEGKPR